MSTLRYDPAHRPGPMGLGHAIRPVPEDQAEIPWEDREERGRSCRSWCRRRTRRRACRN